MNESLLFFNKFLKHGTAIASLAPSSRWLSRATVRELDWDRANVIVELGAGTGPITQVIAEKARPDCRVLVLERDPDFVRILSERFADRPNLEVLGDDACNLESLLSERGIDQADAIVSGLPVPSFPKDLQERYFQAVGRVLNPEGAYHQITELPWVYLNFYRKYFDDVKFVFEPRNLPPAGAYVCRAVKTAASEIEATTA